MVALIQSLWEFVDPYSGSRDRIDMPRLGQRVVRPQPDQRQRRICSVFGLPADAQLPKVSAESLRQYHGYLARHLVFPFVGEHYDEHEGEACDDPIVATGLLEPRTQSRSVPPGLECEVLAGVDLVTVALAELRPGCSSPNRQLLDDYRCWLRR